MIELFAIIEDGVIQIGQAEDLNIFIYGENN